VTDGVRGDRRPRPGAECAQGVRCRAGCRSRASNPAGGLVAQPHRQAAQQWLSAGRAFPWWHRRRSCWVSRRWWAGPTAQLQDPERLGAGTM